MADTPSTNPRSKTVYFTYCEKCGVRICSDTSKSDLICENCASGRSITRYNARDSSQIPYVQMPSESEVMQDIRENVSPAKRKRP